MLGRVVKSGEISERPILQWLVRRIGLDPLPQHKVQKRTFYARICSFTTFWKL